MVFLPCGEPLYIFCKSSRTRSSTTFSCLPNLFWYWEAPWGLGLDLWESGRPNRELGGVFLSDDLDLDGWELDEPVLSPSSLILWTASTPFFNINLSLPLTMINFSSILILQPISVSIWSTTISLNNALTWGSLAGTRSKKSWDFRFAPRVLGQP